MMNASLRTAGATWALTVLLLAGGCRQHRKTTSAPNTDKYAGTLQKLVARPHLPKELLDAKELPSLRWPNFSDYQPVVAKFYEDRNYEIAWTRDGAPTASANAFIKMFEDAGTKGLIPEDYDASRWAARVQKLEDRSADTLSAFDVAMTVNVMRYVSDLRVGRVNPSHFSFDIHVKDKKYDLAEFVSDHAVDSTDVPGLIASVEPDSEEYRRTEAALGRYLALAQQQETDGAKPLPMVKVAVVAGEAYPAAARLLERLQLEGDVAGDVTAPPGEFTAELSAGVKRYQERHGIAADGKLTPQTVRSLNVPMTERVAQLQDSLERWRWLPEPYLHPRLMVNLPEFVLRGYEPDRTLAFKMKVIVGQVKDDHQTPVFTHMMRYLVFRPYWNVPVDIAQKELVPHLVQDPGYLESKNFEVTDRKGVVLTNYTARQVDQGAVLVRERPGPKNSLGLVKFMFPNQYDVYLHSTPAVALFARSRRDFSHGCIRVQKPEDLAVWVLDGQKDKGGEAWDLDRVREAMRDGPDNRTVVLKTPLPIAIFYVTAFVEEDGQADFFNDIYKYDEDLEKVLAKGPPYPVKPEPIVPKTKPGDTL